MGFGDGNGWINRAKRSQNNSGKMLREHYCQVSASYISFLMPALPYALSKHMYVFYLGSS